MKQRWEIKAPDSVAVERLAADVRVSPLLACCLINRNLDEPDAANRFLKPKLADLGAPEAIPNLKTAVYRLMLAREQGEHVVVFGDYDVDGVTSTT